MDQTELRQIEQIIGYHFSDTTLLTKAFYHASAVEDRDPIPGRNFVTIVFGFYCSSSCPPLLKHRKLDFLSF